jgi:hypothetical protein
MKAWGVEHCAGRCQQVCRAAAGRSMTSVEHCVNERMDGWMDGWMLVSQQPLQCLSVCKLSQFLKFSICEHHDASILPVSGGITVLVPPHKPSAVVSSHGITCLALTSA